MSGSHLLIPVFIKIPEGVDEEALTMLSDIFPTGFECGILNGGVKPGDIVAIVGAGPIGLATLATAQLYSPAEIIMIVVFRFFQRSDCRSI
jgi:alcohol dehydrogenase